MYCGAEQTTCVSCASTYSSVSTRAHASAKTKPTPLVPKLARCISILGGRQAATSGQLLHNTTPRYGAPKNRRETDKGGGEGSNQGIRQRAIQRKGPPLADFMSVRLARTRGKTGKMCVRGGVARFKLMRGVHVACLFSGEKSPSDSGTMAPGAHQISRPRDRPFDRRFVSCTPPSKCMVQEKAITDAASSRSSSAQRRGWINRTRWDPGPLVVLSLFSTIYGVPRKWRSVAVAAVAVADTWPVHRVFHLFPMLSSTALSLATFLRSGGSTQKPLSDLRHRVMLSTAAMMAPSTPLSLTKNLLPYLFCSRCQNLGGNAGGMWEPRAENEDKYQNWHVFLYVCTEGKKSTTKLRVHGRFTHARKKRVGGRWHRTPLTPPA